MYSVIKASFFICCLIIAAFGQNSNGKHPYDADKPMPQPVMFGEGWLSTAEDDLNAAFSPDGKTVFFTRNFPRNRLGVILYSEYKNKKWIAAADRAFFGSGDRLRPVFLGGRLEDFLLLEPRRGRQAENRLRHLVCRENR